MEKARYIYINEEKAKLQKRIAKELRVSSSSSNVEIANLVSNKTRNVVFDALSESLGLANFTTIRIFGIFQEISLEKDDSAIAILVGERLFGNKFWAKVERNIRKMQNTS